MPSLQTVQEQRSAVVDRLSYKFRLRSTAMHGMILLLLSLVAIAIDGYHPYSEDAAIYVAGIKQAAHPAMYGSSGVFIVPYLRLSVFSTWSALLVRAFHVPIPWLLFTFQIGTTWLLLYACFGLARRCFDTRNPASSKHPPAVWSSVLLAAVCFSVPVAGSSYFMMDPYVTSRSFSTPFTLLAVSACLDRKYIRTILLLALIGIFHPLMVVYATFFVLLLCAVRRRAWFGVAFLVAAAMAAAGVVQYSQRHVVESIAYQNAVGSRYYFFLANWHWYEQLGVAAPIFILSIYAFRQRKSARNDAVLLAISTVILGLTSIVIALTFAREDSRSHLAAALQPLRPFILIYLVMFLVLGGVVGTAILKRSILRWTLLFGGTAFGLAIVQHWSYPASAQVELPWVVSTNGWNRAFVWVRDNTPANAVVALDADYIHAPGEDGQGFRAIAERDTLADRSKDGGAAAIFPQLADRWMLEQTATTNLNRIGDAERHRRLRPFNVSWIVLEPDAATSLSCPFQDDLAKVCRLQ